MCFPKPIQFEKNHIERVQTIDRDAARILSSAAETYQLIINGYEAAQKSNQPYVIIAGEDHCQIPHYLHHMALIDALVKVTDNFAAILEIPHNLPSIEMSAHVKLSYLKIETASPYCDYTAKLKNKLLQDLIGEKGISVLFADCAKSAENGYNCLDISDKSTADSLLKAKLPLESYSATSKEGYAAREQHIFKTTQKHIETSPCALVYICVGQDHVDGLSQHLEKAAIPHIGLKHDDEIKQQLTPDKNSTVILPLLPKQMAYYNPRPPEHPIDPDSDIGTVEEEKRYTHSKLAHMGYQIS